MKNEPIKHHYIPRFILRNFCINRDKEKELVQYCDKKTKKISVVDIRDLFMMRNLYRDEENCPYDPVKIEKDLARFEAEVSQIIKEKFLVGNVFVLTNEEEEKLKLFFAIMGFRAKNTSDFFQELTADSKRFYAQWQNDSDFLSLWKRNLGYLVNCRSLEDVLNHSDIDEPIKIFMMRDTFGVFGMYFVVAEKKEGSGFIIGDTYPVVINGIAMTGCPLTLYSIYPLSPDRIVLLAQNGVDASPRETLDFRPCVLYPPKGNVIRVKKLYPEEVQNINRQIEEVAKDGFVFKMERDSTNS